MTTIVNHDNPSPTVLILTASIYINTKYPFSLLPSTSTCTDSIYITQLH
ncbi:unnamed protein product [Periconia digitata]|uniref:Uncharacterized protein n=1 Tax=Periconia digitata TaxID=1303443 RepID=A0A9W4XPX9_9PLEO|nr:unnamed protein product [Periconia digitata]